MKMESAKVCGLLATSFLLLTMLTDPTSACTCGRSDLVARYCAASNLLMVQVLDAIDESIFNRRYKINVTKVLKGKNTLKRVRNLYTASQSNLCGYIHPTPYNKDEYVMSVTINGKRKTTSLCGLHEKWSDLSSEEQRGIEGDFENRCP